MIQHLLCALFANCPGALGLFVRQRCYPAFFASCGRGVLFGRGLHFAHPERMRIGDDVMLCDGSRFEGRGEVLLGDKAFIGVRSQLVAHGAMTLGAGVNVGSHCVLETRRGLRIGDHTLLAAYVHVGHAGDGEETPETVVGDGCWLGVRVRVMNGCRIKPGTIVGAHATVTENLAPNVIAVGSPARELRART